MSTHSLTQQREPKRKKAKKIKRGQGKKMVLLDKMWDDVAGGPSPDKGLGKLRKQLSTKPLIIKEDAAGESSNSKYQRSMSVPTPTAATPRTPTTPALSPSSARKPNVWRSVFHPGSNLNTKTLGSNYFDSPQPNSPTVYDWLYSEETRTNHR